MNRVPELVPRPCTAAGKYREQIRTARSSRTGSYPTASRSFNAARRERAVDVDHLIATRSRRREPDVRGSATRIEERVTTSGVRR